ncbi:hypothetical protein BgiMline_006628, partial [Biomphalaria glabrata]
MSLKLFISLSFLVNILFHVTIINAFDYVVWNKTEHSPTEFQLSVCPRRCNGSNAVEVRFFVRCLICPDCYCDRPACEIHGRCCPDISIPVFNLAIKASETGVLTNTPKDELAQTDDLSPRLVCYMFFLVRSCLPDYKENMTIMELCEEDLPQNQQTSDVFIETIDYYTEIFYNNIYCIICNNVDQ